MDAALEGIPQRRPVRAAQRRAGATKAGTGKGVDGTSIQGGDPIKTREHAAVISVAGQMRRLRGLRGHAVPNFGISFHLRAHGCAEVWVYGYGTVEVDGVVPEVIIVVQPAPRCSFNVFGLSLLFACPFSPPSAVLFLLFYHSFVHSLNQACWRQSEDAELTPSQRGRVPRRRAYFYHIYPFVSGGPLRQEKTPTGDNYQRGGR